jgi:hypothetical protein
LATVIIGNSVTSIGDNSFFSCNALTTLTLGSSVQTIGQGAFSGGSTGYSNFRTLTIPNSVTTISFGAFQNCFYLTSVTMGNSVITIGNNAFNKSFNFQGVVIPSITIPASVTSIGTNAFFNNNITNLNITSTTVTPISIATNAFGNPSNVISIANVRISQAKANAISPQLSPAVVVPSTNKPFYGAVGVNILSP